jgi:hypothetical protein
LSAIWAIASAETCFSVLRLLFISSPCEPRASCSRTG